MTDSSTSQLDSLSQLSSPISPIQSEEAFREAKSALIGDKKSFQQDEKFAELAKYIHEALKAQDSDRALTLLTKGALGLGSSDIHYDLSEIEARVRMRIDGGLTTVFTLSLPEYKLLLERLKYKSELKLNITHIPQDGKYRITEVEDGHIDVRVSTLPVRTGENVVCRVLDSTKSIPKVGELGFVWTSKRQIDKSLGKKSGMILVTGPTGSGKTTTLYSMMQDLNTPDRKIITLEDPIEYELQGVVQSEVNEKNGYNFHSGLKALLRQDPDIIMIGEIRDLETANTAAQGALTGHLVLSTLHTKSASETLERLLNMGIPPYILASAIDIIIAQRLVRKLCTHCHEAYQADESQNEIIKWMMQDIGIDSVARANKGGYKLYRSKGCEHCGYTGYKGRMGIYEVLYISDTIRAMIRNGASPVEILAEARKNDLILMREDGVLKAMRGKTSLEEVFSVID
ncbi:MAG: GspE/PulE family protein [Candidatus Gracilibacteria bacterium]|nr:GspE/PulE family protein [Candidatus Gracilibacteria bacterium]